MPDTATAPFNTDLLNEIGYQPGALKKEEFFKLRWWIPERSIFMQRYAPETAHPGKILPTKPDELACFDTMVEVKTSRAIHDFVLVHRAKVMNSHIHHWQEVSHFRTLLLGEDKIPAGAHAFLCEEPFAWGHGSHGLYGSVFVSQGHQTSYEINWNGDLLGSRILRHDLPCCGGAFVKDQEHTGYSTLQVGHCEKCRADWEICDGNHFTHRLGRRYP